MKLKHIFAVFIPVCALAATLEFKDGNYILASAQAVGALTNAIAYVSLSRTQRQNDQGQNLDDESAPS